MESLTVIKHANIFQYILLRFMTSLVVLPLHTLLLQATKKAFRELILQSTIFLEYKSITTTKYNQPSCVQI